MRRTSFLRPIAVLPLVLALLLAGCGGGDDGGSTGSTPDAKAATTTKDTTTSTSSKDGGGAAADDGEMQSTLTLEVRVTKVGGKGGGIPLPTGISCDKRLPATCSGTIECPAPKGDRTEDVCAWLETSEGIATITTHPDDRMCTEQYGGPEVATVTGSIEGHPVNATFNRTNGCEIARFEAASPLWTGVVPKAPAGHAPPKVEVIADPPEAFDR